MIDQERQHQDWLNSMKLGEQGFVRRRFIDAVEAFDRATRMFPDRVEGWINLGSALLEAGRTEASVTALNKAISINPKLMVSHMMLGDALRLLGFDARALASYQQAVSLQRTPLGLNKLACALRIERQMQRAEALYHEAISLEPGFTLARVNLATLQIEMENFEAAATQLNELAKEPLPPAERNEVEQSRLAVDEFFRLQEPLAVLAEDNDPVPLETALANSAHKHEPIDQEALAVIRPYFKPPDEVSGLSPLGLWALPEEWPLIEALFSRGVVNTVDDFLRTRSGKAARGYGAAKQQESLNMEAVIHAARVTRDDLVDPVKAELHLRHWHALACRGLPGYLPGHFKYTQNRIAEDTAGRPVKPLLASATFRHVISEMYKRLEPGLFRAGFAWAAVSSLHPFADGNGRLARNWLNRELEWAGLAPALFSYDLGLKGEIDELIRAVHAGSKDLSPILEVIVRAQHFARSFCERLSHVW